MRRRIHVIHLAYVDRLILNACVANVLLMCIRTCVQAFICIRINIHACIMHAYMSYEEEDTCHMRRRIHVI
jgi:hypothetical protein